ncbi:unnamed protein product [Schistosoma curassoni]|uniref:MCC-bdg_PDZ domain-containing protein n=1 Tax=Schistosoma curassoni TaxID=6186 RepID=A0A183K918_9TREM|nr:unnamed protein product [Schistosoma curassoni]
MLVNSLCAESQIFKCKRYGPDQRGTHKINLKAIIQLELKSFEIGKLNSLQNLEGYRHHSQNIELTNSRCVLQKEVKELETLLATYDNKDGEYHKLVKRYVDCQQQLSLRSTLLHDNDTIQLNRRSHKNFSSRRSLSVDVITRK